MLKADLRDRSVVHYVGVAGFNFRLAIGISGLPTLACDWLCSLIHSFISTCVRLDDVYHLKLTFKCAQVWKERRKKGQRRHGLAIGMRVIVSRCKRGLTMDSTWPGSPRPSAQMPRSRPPDIVEMDAHFGPDRPQVKRLWWLVPKTKVLFFFFLPWPTRTLIASQ